MDKLVVENTELLQAAVKGLQSTPKTMESKWFYDARGSELFEDITELPEYYPTRTEVAILQEYADDITRFVPQNAALIELGSGASTKTRILLDRLDRISAYVPTDISASFLYQSAAALGRDRPGLNIVPVVADFMVDVSLPVGLADKAKVGFFPGSTLGNLETNKAVALLKRVRRWSDVRAFIVGIDLVKDTEVLVQAYDDGAGVTAAFNLNLLRRMNREIGSNFDLDAFRHHARWIERHSRIEMHLVSQKAQTVDLGGVEVSFAKGESIHTENSHKYTEDRFADLARQSGWQQAAFYTDKARKFAVSVLLPRE